MHPGVLIGTKNLELACIWQIHYLTPYFKECNTQAEGDTNNKCLQNAANTKMDLLQTLTRGKACSVVTQKYWNLQDEVTNSEYGTGIMSDVACTLPKKWRINQFDDWQYSMQTHGKCSLQPKILDAQQLWYPNQYHLNIGWCKRKESYLPLLPNGPQTNHVGMPGAMMRDNNLRNAFGGILCKNPPYTEKLVEKKLGRLQTKSTRQKRTAWNCQLPCWCRKDNKK